MTSRGWIDLSERNSGVTGETGATGLTGGEAPAVVDTVGSSSTLLASQEVVLATAGGITLTLPDATGSGVGEGKVYWIKDRDGNAGASSITIDTTSSQTINSFVGTATTFLMTADFQAIALVSDGANWQMVNDDQPNTVLALASVGTTATVGNEELVLATAGGITLTLPSAATRGTGAVIHVKDSGGNAGGANITIDGDASETIDGALTFVLVTNFEAVTLVSDGTNWVVI